MRRLLVLLFLLCLAQPLAAVEPDEMLEDPALEARARALSEMIRCVVCQNESIDSSSADIARDLRILIRERILAGDSDEEILDYLVARYGAYILLEPPVQPSTWLLWGTPLLVLVLGAWLLAAVLKRRRGRSEPDLLSAEEQRALRHLLHEAEPHEHGESGSDEPAKGDEAAADAAPQPRDEAPR